MSPQSQPTDLELRLKAASEDPADFPVDNLDMSSTFSLDILKKWDDAMAVLHSKGLGALALLLGQTYSNFVRAVFDNRTTLRRAKVFIAQLKKMREEKSAEYKVAVQHVVFGQVVSEKREDYKDVMAIANLMRLVGSQNGLIGELFTQKGNVEYAIEFATAVCDEIAVTK